MEIMVGKTSGFCAGVKNAIIKTENELNECDEQIQCLGELVHNKQVIEKLENKGLKVIEDINEAKGKVVIRAHGIGKEIYLKAKQNNIELIDLTCPKVLKIHKTIEEYYNKGYYIILVGVKDHPEVIGSISYGEDRISLISEEDDLEYIENKIKQINNNKILVISQTTYNLKKFENIVNKIKEIFEIKYYIEVKNTICPATKIRQDETREISSKVDCMIIIGGKNSSNTKKLYDVSKENCHCVKLIETFEELNLEEFKDIKKVGIMAGASTPDESVNNVVKLLKKI